MAFSARTRGKIRRNKRVATYVKLQVGTVLLLCKIEARAWAPKGMGKRGHLTPSGNVVKCFFALVITAKRSPDELLMHIFITCHRLLGALPSDPHQDPSLDPTGELSSPDP